MPSAIGAIDCAHIRISKISSERGQMFVNSYKQLYSLNVQVICDADYGILHEI